MPSAFGFVLCAYAVAHLPVTTSTSLQYLVPAFAVLTAFVWLGRGAQRNRAAGRCVVIVGVVLVAQGERVRSRALTSSPMEA